jgi:hypothetical protein
MIDTAAQDLLAADATLVALLDTFGGQPAIFVQGNVPVLFERGDAPYVVLQDGGSSGYLDGERDFFTVPLDVLVLGRDVGDAAQVEAAAWRVRALLDGAALAPTGYASAGTAIESGPSPDDPGDLLTFGRRLRAVVGLIEQP